MLIRYHTSRQTVIDAGPQRVRRVRILHLTLGTATLTLLHVWPFGITLKFKGFGKRWEWER